LRVTPHRSQGRKEDAQQCRRYFEAEVAATTWYDNGGVFSPIYYAHGSVRETVGSLFTHMVSLLEAASTELARAGIYYQETDQATAAQVDAAMPTVQRPIPRKG
jgi:hypothetical protein